MEAPRWEAYLAARTLQRNYRARMSRHIAGRKRFNYWTSVRDKRNLFLQVRNEAVETEAVRAAQLVAFVFSRLLTP